MNAPRSYTVVQKDNMHIGHLRGLSTCGPMKLGSSMNKYGEADIFWARADERLEKAM